MLTSVLQPTHLIFVVLIALLVLGPKRLPEAGRSLGQGIREFRRSVGAAGDDDATHGPAGALPLLAQDHTIEHAIGDVPSADVAASS